MHSLNQQPPHLEKVGKEASLFNGKASKMKTVYKWAAIIKWSPEVNSAGKNKWNSRLNCPNPSRNDWDLEFFMFLLVWITKPCAYLFWKYRNSSWPNWKLQGISRSVNLINLLKIINLCPLKKFKWFFPQDLWKFVENFEKHEVKANFFWHGWKEEGLAHLLSHSGSFTTPL